MRPIITTTILALTLAIAPVAKAQQADNQTMQAVEAMVAKWTQAVNQGDSKTATSLFTSDAFSIDVYGRTSGAQKMVCSRKEWLGSAAKRQAPTLAEFQAYLGKRPRGATKVAAKIGITAETFPS